MTEPSKIEAYKRDLPIQLFGERVRQVQILVDSQSGPTPKISTWTAPTTDEDWRIVLIYIVEQLGPENASKGLLEAIDIVRAKLKAEAQREAELQARANEPTARWKKTEREFQNLWRHHNVPLYLARANEMLANMSPEEIQKLRAMPIEPPFWDEYNQNTLYYHLLKMKK